MQATLIGFSAIVMWSLLALLTASSGKVPPFQLAAMCFTIGTAIGLAALAARPSGFWTILRQPLPVWLLGVGGLFGYHFLYFTALRNAPPVEAGLIAYLWPLLIVVGSALLPGERLGWQHVAGALAGLLGTVLIVSRNGLSFDDRFLFGYGAALLCAFTWSGYSLLSRRFGAVPTDVVTGFCGLTALLSLLCHLALEETVWPVGAVQWAAVAGLGLLPVGAAFYAWDYGVKRGNIQILGTASYAAPLLSTLILIAAGAGQADWHIAVACVLITGGAVLAAKDLLFARGRKGERV
ncbi:DMT family transporter [Hoeflea prorocentri]|uniref:EamA family transporter n=1 Tax=Hoeflea prorocentri TaxID=1922333 RepID=A0A9X3UMP7_9HYPH|nr:EamA family transporter [Hoeflea prorocentri]MCY6383543.1 EamA family transporter [Hoeflea prorocentri]MDA5401343.1 EamA family transporter [Hoeflea prorocentri]